MKTLVNTAKTLPNKKRLKLTPREAEIMELLATGAAQKEIAECLKISRYTVDVHVKSIKIKTGLQKATELATAYFTGRYKLPLTNLPENVRRRIATALMVLSVFAAVANTTDIVRVFRAARTRTAARRVVRTRKNSDFNYLPLTA